MLPSQARSIVEGILRPLSLDHFLDSLGRRVLEARGGVNDARAGIFGSDPQQTLLKAFATHAVKLRYHGVTPSQPAPAATKVPDDSAFLALIKRFHERDYTLRVPEVIPLSPALQRFTRALELMLHQPVTAVLFWSKAGAKAIVHYDDEDNIVIQLSGRKRWYISTDPPGLQNNWEQVGAPLPHLERHKIYDVEVGDLLYIPRGTPHTVDSTSESLHLAIFFRPVTLRDAIVSMLDHLSDFDRTLRETAATHAAEPDWGSLSTKAVGALGQLLAQCRSPDFVAQAMKHRSARVIREMPALPKPAISEALTLDARMTHADLAIHNLISLPELLHFSVPGAHIGIHPGAESALRFIIDNPSFQVRGIPGLGDDVRIALVERLVAIGFLRADVAE